MNNTEKRDVFNLKFYILIFFLFCISIYSVFPGSMTPDSFDQYGQSLSGLFIRHHPPVLAAVWWVFNKIHPTPVWQLLINNLLLWGAVIAFFKTFRPIFPKAAWLFVFVPFFPFIINFSGFIWKDVTFAFSFALIAGILSYYTVHTKIPSKKTLGIIFLLLFYGTAVKYQARFILPVFSIWTAFIYLGRENIFKKIAMMVAVYISVMGGVEIAEFLLCGKALDSKSWQVVKFYDLTPVAIHTDGQYLPKYLTNHPDFSLEFLKERYNTINSDPLYYGDKHPFIRTSDDKNLEELYSLWLKAIHDYPKIYIKHRLSIVRNLLLRHVIWDGYIVVTENEISHKVYKNIVNSSVETYLRNVPWYLTTLAFWMPFSILYFLGAMLLYRKTKDSMILPSIYLSAASISLISALGVFSLAADYRYIYFSLVMIAFAHPFFWIAFVNYVKQKIGK